MTECSVEGCDRPTIARGMCMTHYRRWKRKGDVESDVPIISKNGEDRPECSVEGCTKPVASARNPLCTNHTYAMKKYGTTELPERKFPPRRTCKANCDRQAVSHGYCLAHYRRFTTHGDAYPDVPLNDTKALYAAMMEKEED